MSEKELADKICSLLNGMHRIDPNTTEKLFAYSVECSKALADHPSIVVIWPSKELEYYRVSALGVMNGLIGKHWAVAKVMNEETNKIMRFDVIQLPI